MQALSCIAGGWLRRRSLSALQKHQRAVDGSIHGLVTQKYWWALTLLELDYTVLFMDNDAAVFRDPLQHFDATYDIQGLSDWNYMAELPTPQVHGTDNLFVACYDYAS